MDVEKWHARNDGEEVLNGEVWKDEGGDFPIFRRARGSFGRGGLTAGAERHLYGQNGGGSDDEKRRREGRRKTR